MWPNHKVSEDMKKRVNDMKRINELIPNSSEINRNLIDLIEKLMVIKPSDRISA